MSRCTIITYENGLKEARYNADPVLDTNVRHISTPELTSDEIEAIRTVSIEKLQHLLSNYY